MVTAPPGQAILDAFLVPLKREALDDAEDPRPAKARRLAAGEEGDEGDEDEDDFDGNLPNVEVVATVYAYCAPVPGGAPVGADACPRYDPAVHGRPVYVGQTIQDPRDRDKQHLYDDDMSFDRQYTAKRQHVLVLLDQRRFPPAAKAADFTEETLRPAAAWMDHHEGRWIAKFDTYTNGLNNTKGGQGGWLVAMREARAKAMHRRFRDRYMPALEAYHGVWGNINVPQKYPEAPWLGALVNCLRSGHTTVPPQHQARLLELGFDARNQHHVKRDQEWAERHMPAFEAYYDVWGHINVPRAYPEAPWLGTLVSSLRTGSAVPPQHEARLRDMGFFWCTKSMAVHAARALGRRVEVASLSLDDPEVQAAVAAAAARHAAMLARRAEIKRGGGKRPELKAAGLYKMPFGLKPLGDGTARFEADRAKASKTD